MSEVLPQLTVDDLISVGVTSVGHRRSPAGTEGSNLLCSSGESVALSVMLRASVAGMPSHGGA